MELDAEAEVDGEVEVTANNIRKGDDEAEADPLEDEEGEGDPDVDPSIQSNDTARAGD